jgi:hypothetical protein
MNHNHRYAGVGNQPIIYCSYKKTNERIAELEKQRDGLVAENVALKEANSKLVKEQQASWPIGLLESFLSEHDPRTPATDAALREIGAKAVEKFAEQQSKLAIEYSKLSPGCRDAKELAENALMAREFAQQLREGKV